MNTFLPASYRFTPNKVLNDILKYSFTHPKNSILIYLLWILALIFVLLLLGMLITPKSYYDVSLRVIACAGIMLSGAMAILYYPLTYSSYTAEQFKFAGKSNLSVRMLANGSKPTKIDDYKPYPYKLYYNEKGDGYLGVMTNGKFTPGTEEPAPTFYKYYQYIQQHKLADKFKHDATLKRDGRYLTRNDKAQWILTNNKDVTLHLVDNTKVKQTNVVKN